MGLHYYISVELDLIIKRIFFCFGDLFKYVFLKKLIHFNQKKIQSVKT